MKKELSQLTRKWMQMARETAEQRKQADEFYETNMMQLIEEDFVERNREKVFEKVEYLVASVGRKY